MSGIVGVFYRDGRPVSHATLDLMLSRIRHRGLDGHGIWCGDSVGLAQCTRRSTPESIRERQPYLSQDVEIVLVADVRIDNRDYLIKTLALRDRPTEDITDAHLIHKSYEAWGEDCPDRMEGDFAFAVWDSRQQCIFCARDSAGVKPFYYHLSRNVFVFASEIKALLAFSDVPKKLNEIKVAEYLTWSFEDTHQTFYQDIFRLPPASSIRVSLHADNIERYWSLDPDKENRYKSDEEYISGFQELFRQAVRDRMRSVNALGSTLSGGLDSSSIAMTAHRLFPHKYSTGLKVFSLIFLDLGSSDREEFDELLYIEKMLKEGAFDPVFINASDRNPFVDRAKFQAVFDEPYFAPTLYLFWDLYAAAQDAGVRVLLDGTDGDRTISHGKGYLVDLARNRRWYRLWKEASALNREQNIPMRTHQTVWQLGFRPLIPKQVIDLKRRVTLDLDYGRRYGSLIDPDFAGSTEIERSLDSTGSAIFEIPLSARQEHWKDLTSGLNALSLEIFDKAAAFHNLGVRYPFYDRRLIEYCLALPADQKLNQGRTRYILRAAMRGVLPPEVQWRTTKANLGLAFSRQLSRIERSELNQMVNGAAKILGGYIDHEVLENTYLRFSSTPSGQINDAYTIFGAIVLADWLEYAGFA